MTDDGYIQAGQYRVPKEPLHSPASGDDELRLAIRSALWGHDCFYDPEIDEATDAVLAVISDLRAKAAAADRARECINGMDPIEVALGGLMYVHGEVCRALDGEQP